MKKDRLHKYLDKYFSQPLDKRNGKLIDKFMSRLTKEERLAFSRQVYENLYGWQNK